MCNISDFITSCEMTAEGMLAKWKDIIFSGDYNMDMNLSPDNVHGPHQVFSNFGINSAWPMLFESQQGSLPDWRVTSHFA